MIKFQVSQLFDYVKNFLNKDIILSMLSVEGELSNLTKHKNGNIYFSIKDEFSKLDCQISPINTKNMDPSITIGDKVLISGNIKIRESSGSFIMFCEHIEKAGIGKLYAEFEKIKTELEVLGYFDHEKKKKIPKYPSKVGLITSPTGAAIRDILAIAKENNPYIDIYIYPTTVQGPFAVESIKKGLDYFSNEKVDVIVMGRGGGAYEDLEAFNSKDLAIEIFNHTTPIISAVGHEIDFVISDFVSDLRAATPTDAANKVFFNYEKYNSNIVGILEKIKDNVFHIIRQEKNIIKIYNKVVKSLSISSKISNKLERYELRLNSINQNIKNRYFTEINNLEYIKKNLDPNKIINHVYEKDRQLKRIISETDTFIEQMLEVKSNKLFNLKNKIYNLDINNLLKKGFSVLLNKNEGFITDINDLKIGNEYKLLVNGGYVLIEIKEKELVDEL